MLDIKFIRENIDAVKAGAQKKHIKVDIDKLIAIDDQRRQLMQKVEELQHQKKEIAKKKDHQRGKEIKDQLQTLESELNPIKKKFSELMLLVPQIPHETVPSGDSDEDNLEIRTWGKKPSFNFEPRDHVELAKTLDIIDFDRGIKVSGFRGYFLKGIGSRLELAILHYALDKLSDKGFTPMTVPALVTEETMYGTGYLPAGEDGVYQLNDGKYLTGTSEVGMMGYYSNEILDEKDLPIKFAGFNPCYRKEAGAAGKDTRGIYRLHEFKKIEQVILCKNDPKESVKWHEEITKNAEQLLQDFGLHYRVVLNCGGDLGQGQVKKYDIETWIPSRQKYGETHSASYFYDFQTRRLQTRYRDKNGQINLCHSLNNTMIATPRVFIQILEQFQQKDGSVLIPKCLHPYMGGIGKIEPQK